MRGATVSTACRSSTDVTRGVNLWGVMNSRRSIYWLRGYGALARTDYKEVPPRVDYALTPLGRSLADAIVPLCTWGTENMAEMASIFAKRDTLP